MYDKYKIFKCTAVKNLLELHNLLYGLDFWIKIFSEKHEIRMLETLKNCTCNHM